MARIAKLDSGDNIQIVCEECHKSTTPGSVEHLICAHGEYSFAWLEEEREFIKITHVRVKKFHQMKDGAEPIYWEVTDE